MRAGILALRDTGRCTSDPSDSDISCCVCMRGKKTHLFALRAPYFRGHPPRNDPISSSIAFLASVPGSWSSMDPPPHNSTGKAEKRHLLVFLYGLRRCYLPIRSFWYTSYFRPVARRRRTISCLYARIGWPRSRHPRVLPVGGVAGVRPPSLGTCQLISSATPFGRPVRKYLRPASRRSRVAMSTNRTSHTVSRHLAYPSIEDNRYFI